MVIRENPRGREGEAGKGTERWIEEEEGRRGGGGDEEMKGRRGRERE